ncbi:glycosyltransferase [Marimonas arenosa]|uniref:Glycosyl transferase family 28 C-terminal domain-containing protein n=1 Tax=Marimonas arenosa TaxID=1795305 RepID=A0AAE3WC17_9RHOB|nr:glycosyltransferase [Marimonas arenosa]MDQ2089655.1 hypothetical protein [Marimonas arenosa]
MIFLTVGTHEPFDRLVRAVDNWCAARPDKPDVLGQITARAGYRPQNFRTVDTLDPNDYQLHFREAEFVISHAGMGSIITALMLNKPVVILPRRGHLEETRNDHQYATVQRLRDKPGVFAAEDETALPDLLDRLARGKIDAGKVISSYASQELIDALRSFIHMDDTGNRKGTNQ